MFPELQQVYWHSGLYLQPQHFQSIDLHFNYMLAHQRQMAQPSNYGVIQCELDTEALQNLTVKFDQLRLVLPSGCYLEYPGNCQIAPRSIRAVWGQRDKPLTLWLALRRFDPRMINVTGGSSESTTYRWVNLDEERPMKDVYHEGSETVVQRIAYNAFLISEEEKEAAVDCEFIPIVQLDCAQEFVRLAQNFIPPAVTLDGAPILKKILEGLFTELGYRAHQLGTVKPSGTRATWNPHPEHLIQFLAMCSLNRALPLLNHYCSTPTLHPWHIYGLLAQLVGELASLTEENSIAEKYQVDRQTVESYDHCRLYDCFSQLKNTLITLLNTLVQDNLLCLTLEPDAERIYRIDLASVQSHLSSPALLILSSEKLANQGIGTLGMDGLKIGSQQAIQALIAYSLPGVTVNLQMPPPRQLPLPRNAFCFLINQNGDLWNDIVQQLELAFYWAGAPDDLKVQLTLMGQSA